MLKVHHFNSLTKAESKRLNSPEGGWDSEPRFSRYADITSGQAELSTILKALIEGEYHTVAVVETDNTELAYQLTNHIEDNWTENRQNGITILPGEHRSSSVGDIFEDTESGCFYIVGNIGFDQLS